MHGQVLPLTINKRCIRVTSNRTAPKATKFRDKELLKSEIIWIIQSLNYINSYMNFVRKLIRNAHKFILQCFKLFFTFKNIVFHFFIPYVFVNILPLDLINDFQTPALCMVWKELQGFSNVHQLLCSWLCIRI